VPLISFAALKISNLCFSSIVLLYSQSSVSEFYLFTDLSFNSSLRIETFFFDLPELALPLLRPRECDRLVFRLLFFFRFSFSLVRLSLLDVGSYF
jgi:hypothetical protein